jgi:hypothetical protein
MRKLAIVILFSAGGWAQTPPTVNTPQTPATVSVKPAPGQPSEAGKPSPAAVGRSAAKSRAVRPVHPTATVSVTPTATKPAVVQVSPPGSKPGQVVSIQSAPKSETSSAPVSAKAPVVSVHRSPMSTKPVVALNTGKPQVEENKPATEAKAAAPKDLDVAGRRDPFVSPVVSVGGGISGSGCSAGKRCLAIDQINLRGVVKSDGGMIAVVVNAMDKAYFLRENDPVFNGYVVKITQDSIVFKETFHDRLGKTLTRDITKTITRPVA